jgi:hypothetical protein
MIIIKILFRILVLPFIIGIQIIICIKWIGFATYSHLVHGSEWLHYTKEVNPIAFGNIIYKIIKENESI